MRRVSRCKAAEQHPLLLPPLLLLLRRRRRRRRREVSSIYQWSYIYKTKTGKWFYNSKRGLKRNSNGNVYHCVTAESGLSTSKCNNFLCVSSLCLKRCLQLRRLPPAPRCMPPPPPLLLLPPPPPPTLMQLLLRDFVI